MRINKKSSVYKILRNIYFFAVRICICFKKTTNKALVRQILFLRDKDKPTFFGYHDKIPFNADGSKVLAMSVPASDKRADTECTPIQLGYFAKNLKGDFENKFIPFAETTTWCWQQGCMLQWNPGRPYSEVVFNTLVNGVYGAVVFDVNKMTIVREYQYPIYAIDQTGRLAATLNFSRLGRLRPGYGYRLFPDLTLGKSAPKNDGLFLINMKSGKKKLIASLSTLAKDINEDGYEHYVNHITFSPNGRLIAFYHLWVNLYAERKMRFFLYNINTQEFIIIEDKKKVSHYCWINDKTILATVQEKDKNRWGYSIYEIDHILKTRKININLKTDGHPMRSPLDETLIVSDLRPNRLREDKIVLFDINNNKVVNIAKFFIPGSYCGQVRCDLHPRWDREGKLISADVVKRGKRTIAILDVQPAVQKFKCYV